MTDQQQLYDDQRALEAGLYEDVKALEAPAEKPAFKPTEDQANSIASMKSWFLSGESLFYTQKGYAGTGKTFSISEFIRMLVDEGKLKYDQVVFTAPTNKAVKVLRGYLDNAGLAGCSTRTIYSLLGLSMQPNGEVKELFAREDEVDLSQLRLVIVDEGSMVNRHLMKEITKAAEGQDLPFLFMGDPAQLPPVGEITSPIWSIPDQSLLTKVMRYDNAILDLATGLRREDCREPRTYQVRGCEGYRLAQCHRQHLQPENPPEDLRPGSQDPALAPRR
jgi:exodeoxyribonuclease-5